MKDEIGNMKFLEGLRPSSSGYYQRLVPLRVAFALRQAQGTKATRKK